MGWIVSGCTMGEGEELESLEKALTRRDDATEKPEDLLKMQAQPLKKENMKLPRKRQNLKLMRSGKVEVPEPWNRRDVAARWPVVRA